jgi:hypothetical protein
MEKEKKKRYCKHLILIRLYADMYICIWKIVKTFKIVWNWLKTGLATRIASISSIIKNIYL